MPPVTEILSLLIVAAAFALAGWALLALSYLRNDVSRLGEEAMRLCAFL